MMGGNQDVLDFLNQTKAMYDEDSTNYMICEKAIAAVMGVQKAAMKLAYIHRCIDLYCDREELHDESYWLDYILDPEWIDTDIGWTGDKMTPNQSETPTRCDHTAEVSKMLDSAYIEGYTAAESKYRKMWDEMQANIKAKAFGKRKGLIHTADIYSMLSEPTNHKVNVPEEFGERRSDE